MNLLMFGAEEAAENSLDEMFSEFMAEAMDALTGVESLVPVMECFEERLDIIYNVSESDPVKLLPEGLGRLLQNEEVWRRACELKFIRFERGRWRRGSITKTGLSVVLGIVFCGDCCRKGVWKKGCLPFPGTMLNRLFGEENLETLRNMGLEMKISNNTQNAYNKLIK